MSMMLEKLILILTFRVAPDCFSPSMLKPWLARDTTTRFPFNSMKVRKSSSFEIMILSSSWSVEKNTLETKFLKNSELCSCRFVTSTFGREMKKQQERKGKAAEHLLANL